MERDEEYEHLPSEFYYPEERLDEDSDEAGVEASRTTESQEEIEDFLKEQKSANTLKKTTTDMNTVARYIKDIGKNVKVENLPAAEHDHLSVMQVLYEHPQEERTRVRARLHLRLSAKYPKIFEQKMFSRQHSEVQRLWKVKKGSRCETQVAYSWTRQR